LADTVGFVRDLPHELIAAFRSTLQEAREADLILHLIDASDPNRWQRIRQVNAVLKELEADTVPQIRVYNKLDKLERTPFVTNNRFGVGRAVWLSARTGDGVPLLLNAIGSRLRKTKVHGIIHLLPGQGRQRAMLFEMGAVLHDTPAEDGGWMLELEVEERNLRRFLKREALSEEMLQKLQAQLPVNARTG
jgi:GTP-binding protein HflX